MKRDHEKTMKIKYKSWPSLKSMARAKAKAKAISSKGKSKATKVARMESTGKEKEFTKFQSGKTFQAFYRWIVAANVGQTPSGPKFKGSYFEIRLTPKVSLGSITFGSAVACGHASRSFS